MGEEMKGSTYDIIVIGGGPGGVAAGIRAAQLGGRVAIIEDKHLGGICMNKGCVPFGQMMEASHILGTLSLGKEMGIECPGINTDFPTLLRRQNELIDFMRQGVKGMLNKNKVTLIRGKAKLLGPGKVSVEGDRFSTGKIILATGARWLRPDFPNSDLPQVVNSDYLLTAKALPERCLLFGSGPMIIEIAQFLYRFGCKVWLVTKENTLLPDENRTIRTRLSRALQTQGITVLTKTKISAIKKKKDGLQVALRVKQNKEAISVDLVIGLRRGARLKGLGLETVGLSEKRDFIEVNERMETGSDGIYAIGDVAAPDVWHYSHLASAGGIVAAENIMGVDSVLDKRTITRVAFTQPQVACVGLTSREAKQAGHELVEGSAPLSMNTLGMIMGQNEGIVEVVAEKRYGEVLGIHLVGDGAAEMAGVAVLAMQMEVTLEELARTPFPHPTLNESVAEAARDALGRPIYLP